MKAIEVISIPVSDQQRSKNFYLKLGFEVIVENDLGNGIAWIQLGLPDQLTTISLVNQWPFQQPSMTAGSLHGIFLETEDMDKEILQLRKKGIEIGTMGPRGFQPGKVDESPWGKFACISDPDGNALFIHQNTISNRNSL